MKKIFLLLGLILSVSAFAVETKVNIGYDFNKTLDGKGQGSNVTKDVDMKNGLSIGVESLINNQNRFAFGLGGEYKTSHNSKSIVNDENNMKVYKNANVYTVGKVNVLKNRQDENSLYVVGRAGYGIVNQSRANASKNIDIDGGFYGAVGVGTEIGKVNIEMLYERNNVDIHNRTTDVKTKTKVDNVGVKVGYTFGKDKKEPKVYPVAKKEETGIETPEPIVEEPKVEIPEMPEFGRFPFGCEVNERVCSIYGFKVDGKEPNAAEKASLVKIANVINQFAQNGTIDIVGHTDSTGSDEYNLKLSKQRAENVVKLLKEHGLSPNITIDKIMGYGEKYPKADNKTEKGRYQNRRVDLFFQNVDFGNVILEAGE